MPGVTAIKVIKLRIGAENQALVEEKERLEMLAKAKRDMAKSVREAQYKVLTCLFTLLHACLPVRCATRR
eukprot:COSAG01_NODE_581_length_15195_cov_16.315291_2_plen_70_part_00